MTLPGLMQQTPLMISGLLEFGATAHGEREIISRLSDEPDWRYDYAGLADRAGRAAHALARLGVCAGDRISTLAWNSHRHLELFYAVPGIGAVLHTANPRLFDEQIAYTLNHAESAVLLFDRAFLPLVARLAPLLPHIRHYILLADAPSPDMAPGTLVYEALIAAEAPGHVWPRFDENAGAFLCYTSGTTGDPKGVLYSHRSVVLHAMAIGLSGVMGLSAFDCVMPCSSLYHATAWGLPFAAPINGCKLVLPGDRMDGQNLAALIAEEGVTLSAAVPTILTMFLDHLERTGGTAGTLTRVICGGAAVPRALAEAFRDKYGVRIQQLWGMTEISPCGVSATSTPKIAARGAKAEEEVILTRQGRRIFGLDVKIVDDSGRALPADGISAGALLVRGPWAIERYYRADQPAVDADGWFDTGDIATIDTDGYLKLTDRSKDVIKSGGEWISSIDIENIAVACPGVRLAAVVGVAHPKWDERPVMVIELHAEAEVSETDIRDHIAPHIAKWWMPDAVIFADVPLTAVGKIDKKRLRERYQAIYQGAEAG